MPNYHVTKKTFKSTTDDGNLSKLYASVWVSEDAGASPVLRLSRLLLLDKADELLGNVDFMDKHRIVKTFKDRILLRNDYDIRFSTLNDVLAWVFEVMR